MSALLHAATMTADLLSDKDDIDLFPEIFGALADDSTLASWQSYLKNARKKLLFKTEMCRNYRFINTGVCSYEFNAKGHLKAKCRFCHFNEIRRSPPEFCEVTKEARRIMVDAL